MGKILDNIKLRFKQKDILIQLIIINIAVFFVIGFFNIIRILFLLDSFDLIDYLGVSSFLPNLYRIWTPVTYMFVHESFWHILMNMIVLYFGGQLFLHFFNAKQLGSLYILGGLGGAVFYLLAYNTIPYFVSQPHSILIGASASIMAILFGVSFYRPNFNVKLFMLFDIKLIYLAVFLFVVDFVALTSSNGGGHVAHIGGALIGILFGRYYLKGKDITSGITKIIDSLTNLFTKRHIKLKKKDTVPRFKDRKDAYDSNIRKKSSESDIDRILDKIKESGYASLTKDERNRLFDASKK